MRSKSGSVIFLRRNPEGSFIVLVWVFTSVFSAVGVDAPDTVSEVFSSGASAFSSSGAKIQDSIPLHVLHPLFIRPVLYMLARFFTLTHKNIDAEK